MQGVVIKDWTQFNNVDATNESNTYLYKVNRQTDSEKVILEINDDQGCPKGKIELDDTLPLTDKTFESIVTNYINN